MSPDELRGVDVFQWEDIRKRFEGADLFLGNGFSIRLAAQLGYVSLYEKFVSSCDGATKTLLNGLGTTNFEELQRILLDAKRVAELLGTPLANIDKYITNLREGLIKAIHENHPRAAEIDKEKLAALSEQLDSFADVFTTNYDLFLYHVIMISKDRHEAKNAVRPYNDYFWRVVCEKFLEFTGYQDFVKYKHVFYLHGALFIFPGSAANREADVKLRRGDNWELLDSIDQHIRSGVLPLFVTEGTATQKSRTISQSRYLRFALHHLGRARNYMVV